MTDPELVGGVVSRALAAARDAAMKRSHETGICLGCDCDWSRCGPALWTTQRKCCPDCTHIAEAPR